MKSVFNLAKWLKEKPEEYFQKHLIEDEKPKILFVKPQLIAKDFYRYITPYFILQNSGMANPALTDLGSYEPKNITDIEMPVKKFQVQWANFIVFPFTTQPLKELFKQCKEINPSVKTIFSIDFNFYELSPQHPQYKIFESKKVRKDVEENILHCDTIMVSNALFAESFQKIIPEINSIGKKSFDCITVPYLMDYKRITENLDLTKPPTTGKQGKIRIGIIATENNWEDLNSHKDEFQEIYRRHKNKVQLVIIGFNGTDTKTMKNALGDSNFEVLLAEYKKGDTVEKRPIGILNYFKWLYNANLDLILIPLRKNTFNETSENINRLLEASAFQIPVLAPDMAPYNIFIKDKSTGFLYTKKTDFLTLIDAFVAQPAALKTTGEKAYRYMLSKYGITDHTASTIVSLFTSAA